MKLSKKVVLMGAAGLGLVGGALYNLFKKNEEDVEEAEYEEVADEKETDVDEESVD